MELPGFFLKLIQLCITVLGLVSILLIFINYRIQLIYDKATNEAYSLGDYLLGSKCLALTYNGNVIKSFFSETKLDEIKDNKLSCVNYPNGKVEIKLQDLTKSWAFELGPYDNGKNANFNVAVKMDNSDNSIKIANMVVTI